MKSEGIWPVGRPGREDAGQRSAQLGSWMDLKRPAMRLVEPRDDEDFIADRETMETVGGPWVDVEPGVRRAFRALPRRLLPVLQY